MSIRTRSNLYRRTLLMLSQTYKETGIFKKLYFSHSYSIHPLADFLKKISMSTHDFLTVLQ